MSPNLRAIFLSFFVSFFQEEEQNGVDVMHISPELASNALQKNTKCVSQQYQALYFCHCPIFLICAEVNLFYQITNHV